MRRITHIIFPTFICLMGALLGYFGFAPYNLTFIIFLTIGPLPFLITNAKNSSQAFLIGWLFSFGFFVTSLYWIQYSMHIDIAQFGWLIPICLFGLPALFAIYHGIAAIVLYKLQLCKYIVPLAFALLWTLTEYFRAWAFTGFPWNLIAYSLDLDNDISRYIANLISIIGSYGLGNLLVLWSSLPSLIILALLPKFREDKAHPKYALPTYVGCLIFSLAFFVMPKNKISHIAETNISIIQPNINQEMKWDKEQALNNMDKLINLSTKADILIWPEAALPFAITQNNKLSENLLSRLPSYKYLITGAMRIDSTDQKAWNSLFVFLPIGEILTYYDKVHLVPFGEYMPLANIFPFMHKITPGLSDISKGQQSKYINLPNIPIFSVAICYEIIFPIEVRKNNQNTDWILNLTNDAWFGDSTGPYQHLQTARFRAVELGVPVIRAANTGISAIIDYSGNVIEHIALNQSGNMTSNLPNQVMNTYYKRYGELFTMLLLMIEVLVILISCFYKKPIKTTKN